MFLIIYTGNLTFTSVRAAAAAAYKKADVYRKPCAFFSKRINYHYAEYQGLFKMRSDVLIKSDGMKILAENLGIIEAERFITLILREPLDYTEWQRHLYGNMNVNELYQKITEYETTEEPER